MSDSTPHARQDALSCLGSLISINQDAHDGFNQAAQAATDPGLKQLFTDYALERVSLVAELQLTERQHGQPNPDSAGTLAGALHRTWITLRTGVSQNSDLALLEEAERGEDTALSAYREALLESDPPLPRSITTVLERHLTLIQDCHDEIRRRRDEARLAAEAEAAAATA